MNGKHFFIGAATGRPNQPPGKHRNGVGFLPLGDRHRADTDFHVYYFDGVVEERDSLDGSEKFLKKGGS